MFKRLFGSKLIALFLSMALIGFLIGYDYALLTSEQKNGSTVNGSNDAYGIEVNQNENTISESDEEESTLTEEIEQAENTEEAEMLEDTYGTEESNESEGDGSIEEEEGQNLESDEGLSEENE